MSKINDEICGNCWESLCDECQDGVLALIALKAHAVEVLAKTLCESGGQWSFQHFEPDSGFRLKYIKEARALLGWEE